MPPHEMMELFQLAVMFEDCSVKCLGWSLNSSCQHQFTEPAEETAVEANVIHTQENRKLGFTVGILGDSGVK